MNVAGDLYRDLHTVDNGGHGSSLEFQQGVQTWEQGPALAPTNFCGKYFTLKIIFSLISLKVMYCKHEAENDTNQAASIVLIMFNTVLALCDAELPPEIRIVYWTKQCQAKSH